MCRTESCPCRAAACDQEVARFDTEFEKQAADYKDKKRRFDEDTGAIIRAHEVLLVDEGAKVGNDRCARAPLVVPCDWCVAFCDRRPWFADAGPCGADGVVQDVPLLRAGRVEAGCECP